MQVSVAVVVKSCSLSKSSLSNTFLNYAEYKQACRLLFTIQVQSNIHALSSVYYKDSNIGQT